MPATLFQYATPISISGTTLWTGSVTSVDEPPPFNDSDVMSSPPASASSGIPVTFDLAAVTNPNYSADGFVILVQAAKGSNVNTQAATVELKQGSTVIAASSFTFTTSVTLQSYTLVSAEIAAINYSLAFTLTLTAQSPVGPSGSNFIILSGCAFQLPSVGFDHLIAAPTGFQIVGPHFGLWLSRGSTGYVENVGSETTGALIDLNTEHA